MICRIFILDSTAGVSVDFAECLIAAIVKNTFQLLLLLLERRECQEQARIESDASLQRDNLDQGICFPGGI